MAQKPSVSRDVHYFPKAGVTSFPGPITQEPHAAKVTRVNEDGTADLTVFPPGYPPYTVERVSAGGPEADTRSEGCWIWPPRV